MKIINISDCAGFIPLGYQRKMWLEKAALNWAASGHLVCLFHALIASSLKLLKYLSAKAHEPERAHNFHHFWAEYRE